MTENSLQSMLSDHPIGGFFQSTESSSYRANPFFRTGASAVPKSKTWVRINYRNKPSERYVSWPCMNKCKTYGVLMIGAVFLFDFIITLPSGTLVKTTISLDLRWQRLADGTQCCLVYVIEKHPSESIPWWALHQIKRHVQDARTRVNLFACAWSGTLTLPPTPSTPTALRWDFWTTVTNSSPSVSDCFKMPFHCF